MRVETLQRSTRFVSYLYKRSYELRAPELKQGKKYRLCVYIAVFSYEMLADEI